MSGKAALKKKSMFLNGFALKKAASSGQTNRTTKFMFWSLDGSRTKKLGISSGEGWKLLEWIQ